MKKSKQLSLLSIGTAALTLGSTIPIQAQTIKAQTLQNLNLRTGPSTSHSIILTIKKGSTIEVLEKQGEWSKVNYNGKIGYASSQYIKHLPTNDTPSDNENNNQQTIMECTATSLNVRSGPSTYNGIIGKLSKGEKVKVVYSTSTGWSKIEFKNGYGYVSSEYLKKTNQETTPTPKPDPLPGNTTTMICSATSLNVRSGPSTADNLIGTIKKGDKVEVIEQLNSGWSKIKYEGKIAYVSSQYLSKEVSNTPPPSSTTTTMKCSADVLNVRSGASTSSTVLGKLKMGDKVEVIEQLSSGWSKIKYEGKVAYVSSQYLSKEISSNPPTSPTKFMKCSADILNVRSGPSTSYSIVGKLKLGDKVEVIQQFTNGWTQIKFNNAAAYVNTVYLSN